MIIHPSVAFSTYSMIPALHGRPEERAPPAGEPCEDADAGAASSLRRPALSDFPVYDTGALGRLTVSAQEQIKLLKERDKQRRAEGR
jgi:hypothetical protein